jgi:hypothetical protein
MLEGLDAINWDELLQPRRNRRGEVPAALRALATPGGGGEHRIRQALGFYEHCGPAYYPVALAAVPFLGELLKDGAGIVQEASLSLLLELVESRPALGFEMIDDGWTGRPLAEALHEEVAKLIPLIEASTSPSLPSTQICRARALLSCLAKPPRPDDEG